MKKAKILVMALAIAMAFASAAFAKNGLSVTFGMGYNADMLNMGATILNDGEEGAANSVISDLTTAAGGGTVDVLLSQKDLKVLAANGVITNVEDAGTMSGIILDLGVRYDILNMIWFKTGFNYDVNIASNQKYYANDSAIGGTVDGYVEQNWTAGYMAIPLMLGINIPIQDGKYNIYAGVGIDVYWAFWQIEVKAPAGFINGFPLAVSEKAKLETMGVGIHYTLGFDMEVIKNLSVFVEYDVVQAGGISDKVNLTALGGGIATGLGTPNLYYPVNASKSTFKFGVKYHFGFGTI